MMAGRATTGAAVVVYDPNGVNPYGMELAHLLFDSGHRVVTFTTRDAEWVTGPMAVHAVLARTRGRGHPVTHGVRVALGPIRAVWAARRGKGVLIAVWTRGRWDEWLLARFAGRIRVITIEHNPGGRGQLSRGRRWTRAHLLSRAEPVVHSAVLLQRVPPAERCQYHVVEHLPYPRFRDWALTGAELETDPDRPVRLLLLGVPRADKGISRLPELIRDLGDLRGELVVCGKGTLEDWVGPSSQGADTVLSVVDHSSVDFVPDRDVARLLMSSDCLLAPYVAATQSGTVVMALTWGLGVVAFDSGAVGELVVPESLVGDFRSPAFGDRVREYVKHPWPAARRPVDQWRRDAACAWESVLDAQPAVARVNV
jgi:glycosyltransferase involved in cell wall biosynthesis